MSLPRITVLLANAPTRIPAGNGRERFFVKAGSRWPFSIEKAVDEPCRYVPFPFGLAYLAALLELDGVDVAVYDGVALNTASEALLSRLRHECQTIHINGPSLREPQG